MFQIPQYRLYIDESGDPTCKKLDNINITDIIITIKYKDMGRCFYFKIENPNLQYKLGFSTLAPTGYPPPVSWINYNICL